MDLVLGHGPVAVALANTLAGEGPVMMAGGAPTGGPFFWRRADMGTGAGIDAALSGIERLFIALEPGQSAAGLFTLMKPGSVEDAVVVLPLGEPDPPGIDRHDQLSMVRVGPCWGPEEPLVGAWAAAIAAGRRVWVPNPGGVRPVALRQVVAAAREAAERPGVRWTVVSDEVVQLADLVAAISKTLGKPARTLPAPMRWGCRRAGVDPARVRAWAGVPAAEWKTPGWTPTEWPGRDAWVGDAARWQAVGAG